MGRYYCADGRHLPEGHDPEECPPCLRAQRNGIKKAYETDINVDLVDQNRRLAQRIRDQRRELERLNAKVAGPPSPQTAWEALEAWCTSRDRSERRFASVCFRAGWQAARRALSLSEDSASPNESEGG